MANQIVASVENNFTKGLVTEFTGLNFPENAATDCNNVEFTIVGDVVRRLGVNFEDNYISGVADRANSAVTTIVWNNPGGTSSDRLLVKQIGNNLYFYSIANASTGSPLSTQFTHDVLDLTQYAVTSFDITKECTYAEGGGYMFVYHPSCDPVYLTYANATLSSAKITVQTRDFIGVKDNLQDSDRPSTLSAEHQYNLINQGWSQGAPWAATSTTTQVCSGGGHLFTIATGITGISAGDTISFRNTVDAAPGGIFQPAGSYIMSATVSSYTSGTGALAVNVYTVSGIWAGSSNSLWTIIPGTTGKIDAWHTAIGNYPSNGDVWWYYKNSLDVFDPATTVSNITLNNAPAPKGHILLNAFQQQRAITVGGITDVTTTSRPTNGTWFQGRVWFTGVDSNQPATGDADFYSWAGNIYFSQVIQSVRDFGKCYQTNDPTSDQLFDLLPTDGGVISIPEAGNIFKLFPIANGMLVFASNGVWFITGSQGIGFSANDYTITRISSIRSISSTSYVDVMGLPYFWNEEGIYQVQSGQGGQLAVESITVSTILSFYNDIPLASKMFVKGAYNPIDYVIKWIYKSSQESSVTDRYTYDKILNYNVYNKAFYPYTVVNGGFNNSINSINYILYPSITPGTPEPGFKYSSSFLNGSYFHQFSEENDDSYLDWGSSNFESFFVTGYKVHGKGQFRFQVPYLYMFSKAEGIQSGYKIQGIWDYAITGDSGRWSTAELANIDETQFGMIFRRHRIRGRGIILQYKLKSRDGLPFDIMGWSTNELLNSGV